MVAKSSGLALARANPIEFSPRECGRILIHWKIKTTEKKNQTMALNVKPLGDRILVEAVEEKEVKKGGIIIPDTAKEKPMESMVVALGTGKTDDNGKKVPFEVKKGDRVLVSKYGGTEIKLDGREYKILNSDDVLAVLD
jgi:chaperonin GroES